MKFRAKLEEVKRLKNLIPENEEAPEIVEELFNMAPAQQGMARRAFQKVAGSLGGIQSKTTNKLNGVYKNVWGEYTKYLKTQRGYGQPGNHSIANVDGLLTTMGINKKVLQQTKNAAFRNVQPNATLQDKDAGKYLYTVLQNVYNKSGGYTPTYQLPTSL